MQTATTKPEVIQGTWHNQNGSEIELVVLDDGRLTGLFRLSERCKVNQREFPLTGFVVGNVITFCVVFESKQSATSWSGEVCADGSMRTMWHMVLDAHKTESNMWRAVWTGADVFKRGEAHDDGHAASMDSHPFFCGVI